MNKNLLIGLFTLICSVFEQKLINRSIHAHLQRIRIHRLQR